MEANNSFDDIFEVNKDDKKLQFISSHTYTNIFNEIPFKNSFSNINNIFNQTNKEQIINDDNFNNIIKLNVILFYSYQKEYFEFNFPIKIFYNKQSDKFQFSLNEIVELISNYANNKSIFLNENYSISYSVIEPNNSNYNSNNLTYYFIGNFPLNKNIKYNIDVPLDGKLYLKLRKKISKINSLRYEIFEDENEEEIDEAEEKEKNEEICLSEEDEKKEEIGGVKKKGKSGKKKDCKRSKEKRIGYIVKKVFEWKGLRRLSKEKMSLQDAADNVGLSKKTLDEYFNQIKEGSKYKFDFNKYKKDKVNVLRGFVKKKKDKEEKEAKEAREKDAKDKEPKDNKKKKKLK